MPNPFGRPLGLVRNVLLMTKGKKIGELKNALLFAKKILRKDSNNEFWLSIRNILEQDLVNEKQKVKA